MNPLRWDSKANKKACKRQAHHNNFNYKIKNRIGKKQFDGLKRGSM